jgi:hypothetical protein
MHVDLDVHIIWFLPKGARIFVHTASGAFDAATRLAECLMRWLATAGFDAQSIFGCGMPGKSFNEG